MSTMIWFWFRCSIVQFCSCSLWSASLTAGRAFVAELQDPTRYYQPALQLWDEIQRIVGGSVPIRVGILSVLWSHKVRAQFLGQASMSWWISSVHGRPLQLLRSWTFSWQCCVNLQGHVVLPCHRVQRYDRGREEGFSTRSFEPVCCLVSHMAHSNVWAILSSQFLVGLLGIPVLMLVDDDVNDHIALHRHIKTIEPQPRVHCCF